MGLLIDGVWHDKWYDTSASGGRFERSAAQFWSHRKSIDNQNTKTALRRG